MPFAEALCAKLQRAHSQHAAASAPSTGSGSSAAAGAHGAQSPFALPALVVAMSCGNVDAVITLLTTVPALANGPFAARAGAGAGEERKDAGASAGHSGAAGSSSNSQDLHATIEKVTAFVRTFPGQLRSSLLSGVYAEYVGLLASQGALPAALHFLQCLRQVRATRKLRNISRLSYAIEIEIILIIKRLNGILTHINSLHFLQF